MPEPIRIRVACVPVAQPRQRHALIAGQVRNYTPTLHPVNSFKSAVQMAAREAYQGQPIQGAVSLKILFIMPRPKGKCWKSKPTPRYPHTGKPDSDNLLKSVKDALSKLVWADDAQVYNVHATKLVASGNEQPHVTIDIYQD